MFSGALLYPSSFPVLSLHRHFWPSLNGRMLTLNLVQARNRMVVSYELAQLSTTARKLPRAGAALLVLGSGNVDEILRGYYTKYDASSADISPLGSISKIDIKRFQRWAKDTWDLPILKVSLARAKPPSCKC